MHKFILLRIFFLNLTFYAIYISMNFLKTLGYVLPVDKDLGFRQMVPPQYVY